MELDYCIGGVGFMFKLRFDWGMVIILMLVVMVMNLLFKPSDIKVLFCLC
jgi:hypothetical protein